MILQGCQGQAALRREGPNADRAVLRSRNQPLSIRKHPQRSDEVQMRLKTSGLGGFQLRQSGAQGHQPGFVPPCRRAGEQRPQTGDLRAAQAAENLRCKLGGNQLQNVGSGFQGFRHCPGGGILRLAQGLQDRSQTRFSESSIEGVKGIQPGLPVRRTVVTEFVFGFVAFDVFFLAHDRSSK